MDDGWPCPVNSDDAMGMLARWAWANDMDEHEQAAARSCQGAGRGSRLAWQAVALWGPDAGVSALRKLRRAASARMDARDLSAEFGWEALGHGPEHLAKLRADAERLSDLSEPSRLANLWAQVRTSGGLTAVPLECQGLFARQASHPFGSPAWQRASWEAMSGMDWDMEHDGWMAARALSLIERGAFGEGTFTSGEASSSSRRL